MKLTKTNMKLTKTLDVSELPDEVILKLEAVSKIPDLSKLLALSADTLNKENEELRRMMNRTLEMLEKPDYYAMGRLSHREMAEAIRHMLSKYSITL